MIDNIKYPSIRYRLLLNLNYLATQSENFIDPERPYHFWWSFLKGPVDFLFNELEFDNTPEDYIGYSIRNKEELEIILKATRILDIITEEAGIAKEYQKYIEHPLWSELVNNAKQAYELLKANDKTSGVKVEEYYKT